MKLKDITESFAHGPDWLPDLSGKNDAELQHMMDAAEKTLEQAPHDTTEESDAEELASHIEREIFKRAQV